MAFARKMLIAAVLTALSSPVSAGGVEVNLPWMRATVRGASVAAGYLTLTNKGTESDVLVSARTDKAERAEIHESKLVDGLMTMRAMPKGVEIKPGATVVFKPEGLHLMLVGLTGPLLPGESVPVTLHFAKAGDVAADFAVMPFGFTGSAPLAKPAEKAPSKEEAPSISY